MKTLTRLVRFAGTALLFGLMLNAHAGTTDLAPAPLVTSPTSSVLPNVFLMMDDSGSMAWDYMPDNAGNFNSGTYGAASPQCNGMYYDSSITYAPPVTSTGASYATSSFTLALDDGYNTGGSSTNLSTSFVDPGRDSARPAFYFKYTGTQTTERLKDYYNTNSTFYKECNSKVTTATVTFSGTSTSTVDSITLNGTTITVNSTTSSSSTMASNVAAAITASGTGYMATSNSSKVTITGIKPSDVTTSPSVVISAGTMTYTKTAFVATTGSPVFTKVLVTATSGAGGIDERTNFANWWSYYHTRILMMKTATGAAFSSLGSTFRVGFATINNNTRSDLLALNTFDATQRASWYAKLYATQASNSTPLREALSDVGRMYAHKLPSSNSNNALTSSVPDPIQFSCQQNFVILTTDGFWNGATTYDLNGNPVGNQDYIEARPMYDGSSVSTTTVTPYTTVQTRQTITSNTVTVWTNNETITTLGGTCSGGKNVVTTPYTDIQTSSPYTTTSIDTYTANQQTTQTTINGVVGPTSALTPATPTYTFTGNASIARTSYTYADTGWVAGTATTVCTKTSNIPAGLTSTTPITSPVTSTSTVSGTAVTTVTSTQGPQPEPLLLLLRPAEALPTHWPTSPSITTSPTCARPRWAIISRARMAPTSAPTMFQRAAWMRLPVNT